MRTLPDYPWDTLTPYRERAAQHPGGTVDLSIGTPVDPTPELIREALTAASGEHREVDALAALAAKGWIPAEVAAELTDLIQTQRAYSSNAKVIQTVDEMLQETTNIKR